MFAIETYMFMSTDALCIGGYKMKFKKIWCRKMEFNGNFNIQNFPIVNICEEKM